ncbi:MAG TPA: nuclear transport factor 2 family protein [Streptosporangiaceae bacterium]|nr:nuclear transport factor 2 family protein [Streptosporangiaceae bacterium]
MTTATATGHSPAVTAVTTFYAALGSGDIPAALARLGDTVTWHEAPGMPYQGPEPYHGAQQVAELVLAPITADIDDLTLTNHEILALGTTVAVLGNYAGTAHHSGRPLTLPYLHVWTVINDHITEFRQYTDTAAYRATLSR